MKYLCLGYHGERAWRSMSEAEIARNSPPELADLPANFWQGATLVMPVAKEAISLRVDEDVLQWFRSLGPRYQTRMNAVLRSYMAQAERSTSSTRQPRRKNPA